MLHSPFALPNGAAKQECKPFGVSHRSIKLFSGLVQSGEPPVQDLWKPLQQRPKFPSQIPNPLKSVGIAEPLSLSNLCLLLSLHHKVFTLSCLKSQAETSSALQVPLSVRICSSTGLLAHSPATEVLLELSIFCTSWLSRSSVYESKQASRACSILVVMLTSSYWIVLLMSKIETLSIGFFSVM